MSDPVLKLLLLRLLSVCVIQLVIYYTSGLLATTLRPNQKVPRTDTLPSTILPLQSLPTVSQSVHRRALGWFTQAVCADSSRQSGTIVQHYRPVVHGNGLQWLLYSSAGVPFILSPSYRMSRRLHTLYADRGHDLYVK